jgi:hypothetical protein
LWWLRLVRFVGSFGVWFGPGGCRVMLGWLWGWRVVLGGGG